MEEGMYSFRLRDLAAALLFIGLVAAPKSAEPQQTTLTPARTATLTSDPSKSIQAVLDAQITAWNRNDLEGFMAGYWNSPDFIYLSNKRVTRGWQAVLERYRLLFKPLGQADMGTLELTETQISTLGPEAALVWGSYRVTNPDGKQRGGLYTLVMRKFPEGWRTVYDRTSSEASGN
jgi:uncharacterized protein (TIGR02246 family)